MVLEHHGIVALPLPRQGKQVLHTSSGAEQAESGMVQPSMHGSLQWVEPVSVTGVCLVLDAQQGLRAVIAAF